MTAVSTRPIGKREDGKQMVEAVIIADETPAELPITGDGISGMSVDDCFAPFSVLYVVGEAENKVYIANESGAFIAQQLKEDLQYEQFSVNSHVLQPG